MNCSKMFAWVVVFALVLGCWETAWAQSNSIKGTVGMNYESRAARLNGAETRGVADVYSVDLTIGDTILLQGNMYHTPNQFNSMGMMTQAGELKADLVISVKSPDLTKTKAVGKIMGIVPIDSYGVYAFNDGSMRAGMNATMRAPAYESKFVGSVQGVSLNENSWFKKKQLAALEMRKMVRGQFRKIAVTKYDRMVAQGFVIPSFPAQEYTEAEVAGSTLYDYEREAWLFNDLTITPKGAKPDRVGGSILWQKSNSGGTYTFDVRVNEPVVSAEAAAFLPASSEADFFAEDVTIPGITGTMVFSDTKREDTVVSSKATINLVGSQITKAQARNIATTLLLSYIIPMCSE